MKPAYWTRRTHLFRPDRCPIADEADGIKFTGGLFQRKRR